MATTIRAEVVQLDASASQGSVRTHSVKIDRPSDKGGADQGMMGGEYLLVALGGCFMSNLLAAIQARSAQVSQVRLEIEGTLEQAPSRYGAIAITVTANHNDRELLEKLLEISERACIVANTLKGAVALTIRLA